MVDHQRISMGRRLLTTMMMIPHNDHNDYDYSRWNPQQQQQQRRRRRQGQGRQLTLFLVILVLLSVITSVEGHQQHQHPECRSPPSMIGIEGPNLASLSSQRLFKYQAIQTAIQHAWKGYMNMIHFEQEEEENSSSWWSLSSMYYPPDTIQPISQQRGNDNNFPSTLFDSIDTLYIAQLQHEYKQALSMIVTMGDIVTSSSSSTSSTTNILDYKNRIVGGLLGAYSVSGDILLIQAALRAGHALLEGPFSTSPLPRMYHVLAPPIHVESISSSSSSFLQHSSSIFQLSWWLGVLPRRFYATIYTSSTWWGKRQQQPQQHNWWENTLSGIGSFGLEFNCLSSMTWIDTYNDIQEKIFQMIQSTITTTTANSADNSHHAVGIPIHWNIQTGQPQEEEEEEENKKSSSSSTNYNVSIGLGADTFYEYLVKIPIYQECTTTTTTTTTTTSHQRQQRFSTLKQQKEQRNQSPRCTTIGKSMMELYNQFIQYELKLYHVYKQPKQQPLLVDVISDSNADILTEEQKEKEEKEDIQFISYPVDHNIYHHRLCFIPGMLALGVYKGISSQPDDDLQLAKELIHGCYTTYQRSSIGLGPDTIQFTKTTRTNTEKNEQDNNDIHPNKSSSSSSSSSSYFVLNRKYELRPEVIESLFVLYRVTKDPIYQDWAWEIFQSIEQYCKKEWGYTGIVDVYYNYNANADHQDTTTTNTNNNKKKTNNHNKNNDNSIDDMPSYFVAETLKYLLLLFGPDDYVSLDDYVFTTEGHPLWIPKAKKGIQEDRYGRKQDVSNTYYQRTETGAKAIPPCGALLYDGEDLYDPTVPIPWFGLSLLLLVIGVFVFLMIGCVFCIHAMQAKRQRERRLWERKTL